MVKFFHKTLASQFIILFSCINVFMKAPMFQKTMASKGE